VFCGECSQRDGLLEELWNYWMSHPLGGCSASSTAPFGGCVERVLEESSGVWCVGMLLGPETTPAMVFVLWVPGPGLNQTAVCG
jgi:hypothetical protein